MIVRLGEEKNYASRKSTSLEQCTSTRKESMNDYPSKEPPGGNLTSSKDDTKPSHSYGTLPFNINEAKPVNTEASDGPFRSVFVESEIHSFATLSIGGQNASMMPPPLSRGHQYGKPKLKYQQEKISGSLCDSLTSFDSFQESESSDSTRLSSTRWNVNDNTLKPKPDFYPLEQTATFVPHSKPSVVAARVANFLLKRDISVTFNEVKAKAKCLSKDNVEFNVRLYKGKNQFDHGVIVEVQRRSGFSVFYHRNAVGILDVAAGKTPMDSLEGSSFHNHEAENCSRTQLIY